MNFWNQEWNKYNSESMADLISHTMQKEAVKGSYRFLGDIKGKRLLEVGCGSGVQTAIFAELGALVTAIDASEGSILLTKTRCKNKQINNVVIKKINVENLSNYFKNGSFDLVYINCVLMHVRNKGLAVRECLNTLKKNGKLVVKENLKYWLFSFPYRTFSPYRKTNPEYVTYNFIKNMRFRHKEYYLFSSFFLFLFYLFKNKEISSRILYKINIIDQLILTIIPILRPLCWVSVSYFTKTDEDKLILGDDEYQYNLMRKMVRGNISQP